MIIISDHLIEHIFQLVPVPNHDGVDPEEGESYDRFAPGDCHLGERQQLFVLA